MSAKVVSPSKAALWSLRQYNGLCQHTWETSACLVRRLHTSRPVSEQTSSFRGQLYESTQRRLEKERLEQQRFAKERGEAGGGRTAATLVGMLLNLPLRTTHAELDQLF